MPFIGKPHQEKVDEDTSGALLAGYSAAFRSTMDDIADERLQMEQSGGRAKAMTLDRSMQKVARVPEVVFDYLTLVYGLEWVYSKEFMKWLDRHPEYKVGRTLISGVDVR